MLSFSKLLLELHADMCMITETWFTESDKIKEILEDFKHTTGYSFLRLDRRTDKRGGGVAICYKHGDLLMTKAKIPPSKHEIYAAVGRRTGQRKKVVALVAYLPPWYNAQQDKSNERCFDDDQEQI